MIQVEAFRLFALLYCCTFSCDIYIYFYCILSCTGDSCNILLCTVTIKDIILVVVLLFSLDENEDGIQSPWQKLKMQDMGSAGSPFTPNSVEFQGEDDKLQDGQIDWQIGQQ